MKIEKFEIFLWVNLKLTFGATKNKTETFFASLQNNSARNVKFIVSD